MEWRESKNEILDNLLPKTSADVQNDSGRGVSRGARKIPAGLRTRSLSILCA
jgi:hypothetical protein